MISTQTELFDSIENSSKENEKHSLNSNLETKHICVSKNLNLSFEVNILNEAVMSQQRCFIMTIHDLGFDYSQFDEFVHNESMEGIRHRVVWLHVNLPGQELEASDLNLRKYPTMEELSDELVCVLEYFKVPQVICMGQGAGANICTLFALRHSNKCLGLILIDPIASSASFVESVKFKFNNLNFFNRNSLNAHDKASFIFNRFGKYAQTGEDETFQLDSKNDSVKKFENRNCKNLTLFAESFLSRTSLIEKAKELDVDILIAVGKNSCAHQEAKRFFRSIQDCRRKNPQKLVNSPFLEIENSVSVLHDSPDKLATGIQYFLQGIGLISALPMRKMSKDGSSTPSYGRSISMEEADQPRRGSSNSETGTSPLVSSNPSICLTE